MDLTHTYRKYVCNLQAYYLNALKCLYASDLRVDSTDVHIGKEAGETNQQSQCIAIGYQAGETGQGTRASAGNPTAFDNSVAIGYQAGQTNQAGFNIAIGYQSGQQNQELNTVAVGTLTGTLQQGENACAMGVLAGYQYQGGDAVAMGTFAGSNRQKAGGVAIGFAAGGNDQGTNSVALGWRGATEAQGNDSVAVGYTCGQFQQGASSVAIGSTCGTNQQSTGSVAIGAECGTTTQGTGSVALGYQCGKTNQGPSCVSIGYQAGYENQEDESTAIGHRAGAVTQANDTVAIGSYAGEVNQLQSSVAIGNQAGRNNQGRSAIAIGRRAGLNDQHNNSIIISAQSAILNSDGSDRLYISPIRNTTGLGTLSYNETSKEITTSTSGSVVNMTMSGTTDMGGLTVRPNVRDAVTLSECFTIGDTPAPGVGDSYPNFAPSSNNQNGYRFASTSVNAYQAFGSYGTQFQYWRAQTRYANGGPVAASPTGSLIYNGSTVWGDYLWMELPFELVANQVRGTAGLENVLGENICKTFLVYAKRYWDDDLEQIGTGSCTITNLNWNITVTRTTPIRYLFVQLTSMWYNEPTLENPGLRNVYIRGELRPTITQNVYTPQSLIVGPSTQTTLDTTNTLVVNGQTKFNGGTVFGGYQPWTPFSLMPSTNGGTGYYMLPGGLLFEWQFLGDPGTTSTTWTYPVAFTVCFTVQATKAGTSNYNPVRIETFNSTTAVIDSAYGGGDKGELYCFAIGYRDMGTN